MIKTRLKILRDRVICKLGLASSGQLKELIYQGIFSSICARMNISNKYYPVGSAANYSLLYLVSRIIEENEIKRVLELGAGQTTILLNELSRKKNFSVDSFEDDAFWAEEIQKSTGHHIHCQKLVPFQWKGRTGLAYDFSTLEKEDQFDLLIIDGPMGTSGYSRLGAIQLLKNNLAGEFIIIFDDAERKGEMQTVEVCKSLLRQKSIRLFEHRVIGLKTQHILATEKFKKITFY